MSSELEALREKTLRVRNRVFPGKRPWHLGEHWLTRDDGQGMDWVICRRGDYEQEASITDEEWFARATQQERRADRKAAWFRRQIQEGMENAFSIFATMAQGDGTISSAFEVPLELEQMELRLIGDAERKGS